MAAAIHRCRAAIVEPGLGGDVDYTGGTQTVLRWQRTGQEVEAVNQPRRQRLAKYRQPFRQDDTVDAILEIVVVVADVELAKAVLHYTRQLQDNLIELLVVATGKRLDRRVGNCVACRAE